MKRIAFGVSIVLGLASGAIAADPADPFLGHWSATQGSQTISWDIAANKTAIFSKDGNKAGEVSWVMNADGTVALKAPPGDFVAKLISPGALGSPPAIFHRN